MVNPLRKKKTTAQRLEEISGLFEAMNNQIEALRSDLNEERNTAIKAIRNRKDEAGKDIDDLKKQIARIENDRDTDVQNFRDEVHSIDHQTLITKGITAVLKTKPETPDGAEVDLTVPVKGE